MALFIGIMSGTSLDSIDTALCEISEQGSPNLLAHYNHPFPELLQQSLRQLCQPGNNEIEVMGRADRELGQLYADAVTELLHQAKVSNEHVTAIGCHGQTIRHRPPSNREPEASAFTLQIGDPNTLAARTGITVVSDFRRRDIVEGGQGAPLAPAFHHAVFSSAQSNRAIVNIGGMANITLLPAQGECTGFDTGPGNVLMDAWIQQTQDKAFDDRGKFAASGKVQPALLSELLAMPYFGYKDGPRSTGREDFDLAHLQEILERIDKPIVDQDVQASLLEFTATTISRPLLEASPQPAQLFVCGGGAFNTALMQRLETLLHPIIVASSETLGVHPLHVEAMAFAWLAYRRLKHLPGNLPSVTGARQDAILGAIYPA